MIGFMQSNRLEIFSSYNLKNFREISKIFLTFLLPLVPIIYVGLPYFFEKDAAGAALEEEALAWISANNIKNDFFRFWGMSDYGLNSPSKPIEHVFYTHFPSGPDVLLALQLKIGLSEKLIKQILIMTAISSVIILWRILKKLTFSPLTISILVALYLWSFDGFWSFSNHYVFAYYFPSLFLSILGLLKIIRAERFAYTIFVSALTFSYVTSFFNFFTILTTSIILGLFIKSVRRKLLFTCVTIAGLLFCAHLARNSLVLGLEVAVKELLYTIGNRAFGTPDKSSVANFFRENNIAWWGTDNKDLAPLYSFFRDFLVRNLLGISVIFLLATERFIKNFIYLRSRKQKLIFDNFEIFITLSATSFIWYLLFPHQGKNYFFPPIFHTSTIFGIIALVIAFKEKIINQGSQVFARSFLLFAAIFVVINWNLLGRDPLSMTMHLPTAGQAIVALGSFGYFTFLYHHYFASARPKVKIYLLGAIFASLGAKSYSFLGAKSPQVATLIFIFAFFVLCFVYLREFLDSKTGTKSENQKQIIVVISLILVTLNFVSIIKMNQNSIAEIKLRNFENEVVRAFESLPELEGVVWTNINAPLLFRYTGGSVIGYCTERGIREKDSKLCYSGSNVKVDKIYGADTIVLSEVYSSGDVACFKPDPCFERLLNYLDKTRLKTIVSFNYNYAKHNFYIYTGGEK